MEINIDNAFSIAVKWTCGPCLDKYQGFAENALQFLHITIFYFLRKPFITTLIGSILIILIITFLFVALIALVGVCCLVIVILLVEGFLIITFISMMIILLSNMIFLMAIIYEIRDTLNTQQTNVIN